MHHSWMNLNLTWGKLWALNDKQCTKPLYTIHTWTGVIYRTFRSKTLYIFSSFVHILHCVVYRGTAFEVSGQNLQLPAARWHGCRSTCGYVEPLFQCWFSLIKVPLLNFSVGLYVDVWNWANIQEEYCNYADLQALH